MDSVRYFKELSKAELGARRSNGDATAGLQQVQHQVALEAGYPSWAAMLNSSDEERQLAAAMSREPHLNQNGFGPGVFAKTARERDENLANWRQDLRNSAERVEAVRSWLEENIEPRRTINSSARSYGLKHLAEREIGYVTNGEFIAAAIIAGYAYRREAGESPNATFSMSSKSITALRSRLRS